MSDYYTEQLVKQKAKASSMIAKTALIVVTVLSFFFLLLFPMAMIIPVIMVVVDIVLFKRFDLEFEYLYVNGDLDIDKIMAKQKRKRVFEMNVRDMEVLAPTGSIELQQYQRTKTYDFSSGVEGARTYEMVTISQGQTVKIIFEPNKTILEGMKMLAPRKVFI